MTNQDANPKSLKNILSDLMLQDIPAYANKLYYSLGFLSMTSLLVLIVSGTVLAFAGPNWWLMTAWGLYFRSIHLWAAQAFIFFILLHLLIVFLTSGYRSPRRLTWVIGALMGFAGLIEAEFGYGLRGDFSSQWRVLQASDLYNGSGLGKFVNNRSLKSTPHRHSLYFFLIKIRHFHNAALFVTCRPFASLFALCKISGAHFAPAVLAEPFPISFRYVVNGCSFRPNTPVVMIFYVFFLQWLGRYRNRR